jgi:hypothetical protein
MALQTTYQFLEPRAESNYRQLFVRGRSLRAETLYRATIGAEPRTPEEVAADFGGTPCRGPRSGPLLHIQ